MRRYVRRLAMCEVNASGADGASGDQVKLPQDGGNGELRVLAFGDDGGIGNTVFNTDRSTIELQLYIRFLGEDDDELLKCQQ